MKTYWEEYLDRLGEKLKYKSLHELLSGFYFYLCEINVIKKKLR